MRLQNGPRGLLAEILPPVTICADQRASSRTSAIVLSETRGLCWPARHPRSPMSLAASSVACIIPNEFAANLAVPANWARSRQIAERISSVQGEWHDRPTRGKDYRLAGERLYSCSRSGLKHPHA